MIDLLPVLVQATVTTQLQLKQWFARYPAGMPWSVISDYCIGDVNKGNDVFSFVVVAPHDKAENISEYIARVAPKDLKNTGKVPLGLIQYLTCEVPVTFSVSFVTRREDVLLRDYLSMQAMDALVAGAISFMHDRLALYQHKHDIEYHENAIRRLKAFKRELEHKGANAKLARQIHLVAAMVATLCNLLNQAVGASVIRWISDRDAMFERHDAVVSDLAYVYYLTQAIEFATPEQQIAQSHGESLATLVFEIPEKTAKHRFDELVRLPDYLAGTLADLNNETMAVSREKFDVVLNNVFVNSKNNWLVQMTSTGERITARSALFRSCN
ncbi:hypothetical protein BSZ31_15125 [Limnobacter sp. SAORIC-690]|uniref:hypothetical protein n=1 Tax=Limnobacter sp. SAORIC-690 TaxID=1923970 RepID=UPI000CF3CD5A|nr:hypothetical protein [Limnobacter sp. SAORIC-690]PQJ26079.1 hypothetical protein BSZ31_15125 [Limnobacter sp. SAORIC-690]